MDIWSLWVRTALTGAAAAAATPTTSSLGVRLEPSDVAEIVWRAANHDGRLPRVHWHVGSQTKLLNASARLSPGIVNRWFVSRTSRG
jgi:hypothetical protein